MEPTTFAFLIIGCMIPYWFAALTMKSVGKAAGEMVAEVKRQFSQKDLKRSKTTCLRLFRGISMAFPSYFEAFGGSLEVQNARIPRARRSWTAARS